MEAVWGESANQSVFLPRRIWSLSFLSVCLSVWCVSVCFCPSVYFCPSSCQSICQHQPSPFLLPSSTVIALTSSRLLLILTFLLSACLSYRNSGSDIPTVQGGRLWKGCGIYWWRDSDRTGCEEEDWWVRKTSRLLIYSVTVVEFEVFYILVGTEWWHTVWGAI